MLPAPRNCVMSAARRIAAMRRPQARTYRHPPTSAAFSLGDFEVDFRSQLGAGAYGTVYKGRHLETDREVAIKTMSVALPVQIGAFVRSQDEVVDSIAQEEQAVEQLCRTGASHPNVVECLGRFSGPAGEAARRGLELQQDAAEEEPVHYFVYELLTGETLQDRIQRQGLLKEEAVKDVVRAMCEGLSFLHRRGVIHRDVKPANVLYSSQSHDHPKLIDFSSAAVVEGDGVSCSRVEKTLGTIGFIAPEVLSQKDSNSPKCDVFSLGCTVHSMLANGRLPRHDRRIGIVKSLPKGTSQEASQFLDAVLCVNPDSRPTVEEVLRSPWLHRQE